MEVKLINKVQNKLYEFFIKELLINEKDAEQLKELAIEDKEMDSRAFYISKDIVAILREEFENEEME